MPCNALLSSAFFPTHVQKASQMCQVYKRYNGGPSMRTAVPAHGLAQSLQQLLTLLTAQHIAKPMQ